MMEEELYLHIYAMTPLTTLGLRGMWEYVRNGNATPFPSSFQLWFVHADEAKMQSVKENVKMKDRWEMEFSLFKCTRLIFRHHTLWLSWLDTCQTYRLTDYTVLNLTCLREKLFHAHTHTLMPNCRESIEGWGFNCRQNAISREHLLILITTVVRFDYRLDCVKFLRILRPHCALAPYADWLHQSVKLCANAWCFKSANRYILMREQIKIKCFFLITNQVGDKS